MAKKAEEPTTEMVAVNVEEMPTFLQKAAGEKRLGTEHLGKYKGVTRLAIVTATSQKVRKTDVGVGNWGLFPDNILAGEGSEPLIVIPLYCFVTFEKWSDYDDDDQFAIVQSTTEESSELARRCNAFESEPYDDGTKYVYEFIRSMNYLVRIDSGPMKGAEAIVTFNRSNRKEGEKLSRMLDQRPNDIFANRVALHVIEKENDKHDWLGIKFNNVPAELGGSFLTDEALYKELEAKCIAAEQAYANGTLSIDYREDRNDTGDVDGGEAASEKTSSGAEIVDTEDIPF